MTNEVIKARIKMITAMVIIGTIGLFTKNILIPANLYVFLRAALATCAISIYLIITKQRIEFARIKKEFYLFILSGAFLGLNWSLLFEAYKYIPYSVATICDYFAPVIVIILCPIVFKEKLTIKQIVCSVMATVGLMLLVEVGMGDNSSLNFYGVIIGILAMLCYVPVLMINKIVKTEGIHRSLLQFVGATIVLGLFSLFKGDFDFTYLNLSGAINLIILGVVHTGIAYCLLFSAIPKLPGQQSVVLTYIDPLTAVLVSFVFLNEPMSGMQIFGGVLLLTFTLINEITFKKER